VTANYERPAFAGSLFKAPRGTATLKKEQADKHESDAEIAIKKLIKLRDGKCRWPERHKCRGGLEVIHVQDHSTGGAFITSNLWLGCKWIHRTGPKSIHSKDLVLKPLTKRGTDGPCAFYRRVYAESRKDHYTDKLIARERAVGVLEA